MSVEPWDEIAVCCPDEECGLLRGVRPSPDTGNSSIGKRWVWTFEEIVERVANVKKKTGLVTPPEQLPLFIEHQIEGSIIPQRPRDGYVNATRLCKTAGKLFGTYHQNKQTKEYLEALSLDIGIPISNLIQTIRGRGDRLEQGTWVHPQVATHLAQWLSQKFAVQVNKWVFDWMSGNIDRFRPLHLRRFLKNRAKIPYNCFSMLNELYLNLVAPLEDAGVILPDGMMPGHIHGTAVF